MSYGIHILNSSGRTVINSDEVASLFYAGPSGTAVADTTYPVSNWSGTKLILARPASTAVGSGTSHENGKPQLGVQKFTFGWGPSAQGFPSSSNGNGGGYVVWRELKAQSTASITPTAKGLIVYDGLGTASTNILFSATDLDVSATLVASGRYNGTATDGGYRLYTEFNMDSSLDQGRYYALMTDTVSYAVPAFGGYLQSHYNFEFDYAAGKIKVLNYSATNSSSNARSADWAIFYLRNGGSVDDNFS
tara:strand:- start:347 stop:1090 length:744 start_codon:yes stop_codon:yes gene_type:complete